MLQKDKYHSGLILKTSAAPVAIVADDMGGVFIAKEQPDSWSEIDARLEAVRLKLSELSSRR